MSYTSFPRTSSQEEENVLQEALTQHYPTNTLQIPQSNVQRFGYPAPVPLSPSPYVSPYAPLPLNQAQISTASGPSGVSTTYPSTGAPGTLGPPRSSSMSAYSSSSQGDTVYSSPGPIQYSFDTLATMSNSLSQVREPIVPSRGRKTLFPVPP